MYRTAENNYGLPECLSISVKNEHKYDKTHDIVGYACGDKICKHKGLMFNHFAFVRELKTTKNAINKDSFIHFIGFRDDIATVLITKLKKTESK